MKGDGCVKCVADMQSFRPPPREANILEEKHAHLLADAKTTEALLAAVATIKTSKEMSRFYPARKVPSPHATFMPTSAHKETVALTSYPRSGNTLMRGLLERVSGIYTGSDSRPMRYLSEDLRDRGLLGESVVTKRVWIVKTHFPEREGWKYFNMNRVILLVRNPFNCIDSYFNMTLTGMHDRSIEEGEYIRFAEQWQEVVEREAKIWRDFHKYWLDVKSVPILIVRFEDLQANQSACLNRIFSFLCEDKPPPIGSNADFQQRIASLSAAQPLYKPRTGNLKAYLGHFSSAQYQYVLETTRPILQTFGYDKDFGMESAGITSCVSELNRGEKGSLMGTGTDILRVERIEDWKYELREIVRVQPAKEDVKEANQTVISTASVLASTSTAVSSTVATDASTQTAAVDLVGSKKKKKRH